MTAKAVAWRWTRKDIPDDWQVGIGHPQLPEASFLIEPLYASPPPVQPVVRALAWRRPNEWIWEAEDIYRIEDFANTPGISNRFVLTIAGTRSGRFDTGEDAKAAAQADYESRILSALTAPPSPAPGVTDAARRTLIFDLDRSHDWPGEAHHNAGMNLYNVIDWRGKHRGQVAMTHGEAHALSPLQPARALLDKPGGE